MNVVVVSNLLSNSACVLPTIYDGEDRAIIPANSTIAKMSAIFACN